MVVRDLPQDSTGWIHPSSLHRGIASQIQSYSSTPAPFNGVSSPPLSVCLTPASPASPASPLFSLVVHADSHGKGQCRQEQEGEKLGGFKKWFGGHGDGIVSPCPYPPSPLAPSSCVCGRNGRQQGGLPWGWSCCRERGGGQVFTPGSPSWTFLFFFLVSCSTLEFYF